MVITKIYSQTQTTGGFGGGEEVHLETKDGRKVVYSWSESLHPLTKEMDGKCIDITPDMLQSLSLGEDPFFYCSIGALLEIAEKEFDEVVDNKDDF